MMLGRDPASGAGFLCIGREWLVSDEGLIAFDRKPELAADMRKIFETNVTQFGVAESQVAQPEQPIRIVRIALRNQPRRRSIGGE